MLAGVRLLFGVQEPSYLEAHVWSQGRGWVVRFPTAQQSHLVILGTDAPFLSLKNAMLP